MKVAVAQISCLLGDPEANLLKVREFSRRANETGAELIVFPEMTDTGYSMPVIRVHANHWNSGFLPGLQETTREFSIAIVSGVSERDGASIYNSQVLIDSRGDMAEMYRKLAAEQNVGAFLISSAWPFPRVEHFQTLSVARAIENQAYVIASNRVGKDDDLWFCGSSAIIDPRGVVVAAASADREELIYADMSEELVLSVRSRVESFAHRRQDLYGYEK